MKISVVVQTYNAEEFLRECLEAASMFDEVLVCDMYSTDNTIPIAKELGARIIYHEHTGIVEPARNFAISNASNEWVLVVDADEIIPEALKEYLYEFINSSDGEKYSGLYVSRKNYFMGRFMHGSYPNQILRFMRKSKTDWPVTVHATPIIDGLVARAPRSKKELALIHLGNDTMSEKLEKLNRYSTMETKRRIGERNSIIGAFFRSTHRFMKEYFLKGGFKSGKPGFADAAMSAMYKFLTIAKLWEVELTGGDQNDKKDEKES